jgi:hypothetical protein
MLQLADSTLQRWINPSGNAPARSAALARLDKKWRGILAIDSISEKFGNLPIVLAHQHVCAPATVFLPSLPPESFLLFTSSTAPSQDQSLLHTKPMVIIFEHASNQHCPPKRNIAAQHRHRNKLETTASTFCKTNNFQHVKDTELMNRTWNDLRNYLR